MHCFFCSAIGPAGSPAALETDDRKHLFRTLRAVPGEVVELTDGHGTLATAEVADGQNLTVKTVTKVSPPAVKIHLFIAPPRHQKMDILLKQCAEIGVWSLVPMLTARSVSTPEKAAVLERWRTLLIEGCKQAKNPFVPEIMLPIDFSTAVKLASKQGYRGFIGSLRASSHPAALTEKVSDAAWFVGPEGGFTEAEEAIMKAAGFTELRLGPWVLRVETAAVVGAAILLRDLLAAAGK